jgi:hypothetical protein
MSKSCIGGALLGFATALLASGVANASSKGDPGYRCTADSFRYFQQLRDEDSNDSWVTRIGFTKDRKLTWSVDARWDHPGEGFVANGSVEVTLDGIGLYRAPTAVTESGAALIDEEALQAAASVEQVGEDFSSIRFESLNYGEYTKARGLIKPITNDVYQGCPPELPIVEEPVEPPTGEPVVPETPDPLVVTVCSDQELPIFGGAVTMPSVPRYPERTLCALFDFAEKSTVDGFATPLASDVILSPVDFPDLSRTGSPKTCRYSSSTCSTSASCEANPCVLDPATPGIGTCALGPTTAKPFVIDPNSSSPGSTSSTEKKCRVDEDCSVDQCQAPNIQTPSPGTFFGIRMTVVTKGSVEVGDDQRLAQLMKPMWDRRGDATARGLVFSKVLSEQNLGDDKVERTMLYLFQLTAGAPMTFITRWD